MESLGKFPDSFLAEIAGQPHALRRAADGMLANHRDALVEIARAFSARPRVVFAGMGASHFVGYVPATSLAAEGIAALHVDAAELLHFRLPILDAATLLILVSQSGESAEPVALARRLRERNPADRPLIVSVANGAASTLEHLADIAVDTGAGAERGPSTLSFGASIVALTAIARALIAGARAHARMDVGVYDVGRALGGMRRDAEQAAEAAERLLGDDPAESAAPFFRWLDDRRTLVTLGRGAARAASEMGALILKEAARLPAESLESAQFRHGPLELAGPELAAFVVASEPATEALDLRLAGELAERGAGVLAATASGDAPVGVQAVRLGSLDRSLAPAVAVIPVQLLAWRLSVDRGFDPTALETATKVTTRE